MSFSWQSFVTSSSWCWFYSIKHIGCLLLFKLAISSTILTVTVCLKKTVVRMNQIQVHVITFSDRDILFWDTLFYSNWLDKGNIPSSPYNIQEGVLCFKLRISFRNLTSFRLFINSTSESRLLLTIGSYLNSFKTVLNLLK